MADLAAVFHWPPDVMWEMYPEDLVRWHALARERDRDRLRSLAGMLWG